MIERQEQLKTLMWKEVADKSTSAAATFSFFAILIYFYHFDLIENREIVKFSCLAVLSANFLRLWISKKMGSQGALQVAHANLFRTSVWLNAMAWSLIFSATALEHNFQGHHFSLMMVLMLGFMASSLVTLAYDKTIFFPYQAINLLPISAAAVFQYTSGKNPDALHYLVIFGLFLAYQFKQYLDYRGQLLQRFNYQIDLEVSYDELKRSQEAFIAQSAKLMHASKIAALGEMAGGLAHEVNNSLMVILGSTRQIERELTKSNGLDPRIEAKIEHSTKAITKIKTVIEGLRCFSLQTEPSHKEHIELSEVIERTLHYCQELLKVKNIDFKVAPIPNVKLICSPFQITQILFNLTKNAEDAVNKSELAQRWIRYEFEVEQDFLFIRVKNGGELIPQHHSERLFQPFFTTKDIGQGTGLSLSIAKGIAQEHKGDLSHDGSFGHTTFSLKLPLAE